MFCSHFRTKFRKCFTKIVATIVAVSMFFFSISPATYAFAKANITDQHSNRSLSTSGPAIIPNNDGSVLVKYKDKESTIKVHETYDTRTTIITDKKSGNDNKLILDKKLNTIFSTYTGKTIQLGDYSQQDVRTAQKTLEHSHVKRKVEYGPCRDGSTSCGCKIERMPWRQMKDALTFVSAADIVGLVLTCFPATAAAGNVISKISTILGAVGRVVPNDNDHGIAFKLCKGSTIRMQQWGSTFDVPVYKVVDTWTY